MLKLLQSERVETKCPGENPCHGRKLSSIRGIRGPFSVGTTAINSPATFYLATGAVNQKIDRPSNVEGKWDYSNGSHSAQFRDDDFSNCGTNTR
jgi:hypothetical protein